MRLKQDPRGLKQLILGVVKFQVEIYTECNGTNERIPNLFREQRDVIRQCFISKVWSEHEVIGLLQKEDLTEVQHVC